MPGGRVAYLLAALGGALGALARWGAAEALPHSPGGWPWATLLVNLTGCLLIGVLTGVLAARRPEPAWARPFLAVGVLGGYTTYSAFAVEVVGLTGAGAVARAGGYVLVSVLGGVLAVAAGVRAVRGRAR
ncbi:fluoride efflux transporter FluC [Geodermatophilus maliterrae]|uniref:Fluoride-specific ion channel FluC n=1 Tax=Geodermatophilus maliterrae TaxID=3162531 RepID=A0ABV3XK44_9ACTN